MDGVLCDLYKAILSFHDRMDLFNQPAPYALEAALGMTIAEVWLPIIAAGWEWWADIEPFPWTFELWAWAHEVASEVYILTSPLLLDHLDGRDVGYAVHGKMVWIRRHFGRKFRKVIFTSAKHTVSQPGTVLIDDDEGHEAAFNRSGGRQIVFPCHHNRLRDVAQHPMENVRAQYQLLEN